MYTQPEQRAGTGNAGDSDINMWQLLLRQEIHQNLIMENISGIIFCNAGNKIVLSRTDLYSRKRTGAGDDIFRRAFGNNNTDKK